MFGGFGYTKYNHFIHNFQYFLKDMNIFFRFPATSYLTGKTEHKG